MCTTSSTCYTMFDQWIVRWYLFYKFMFINPKPSVLFVDIVNNYPVTKNKPIYHIRISEQMKW